MPTKSALSYFLPISYVSLIHLCCKFDNSLIITCSISLRSASVCWPGAHIRPHFLRGVTHFLRLRQADAKLRFQVFTAAPRPQIVASRRQQIQPDVHCRHSVNRSRTSLGECALSRITLLWSGHGKRRRPRRDAGASRLEPRLEVQRSGHSTSSRTAALPTDPRVACRPRP